MLVAMEGSVGYGIGGARVELEIGYERFKTKGLRDRVRVLLERKK
ncbi:Surface antigen [Anaplasma phagocytophilum]|nr:Surface antigen [Anaplasma phagocytophilum]SBO31955.1 Surface antigen [Anaplasma phagocytophilum]